MSSMSSKEAKLQADRLTARLAHFGISLKRTQALEAVAAVHNFSDWNRFQAALEKAAMPSSPVTDHSSVKFWSEPWRTDEAERREEVEAFLRSVVSAGVGIVGLDRLVVQLSMAAVWQQEFLHVITDMQRSRLYCVYVLSVFEESPIRVFRDLLSAQGFSEDAMTAILGSVLRISHTPVQFLSEITECGIQLEGARELQWQLEAKGHSWISELVSVLRTCRKDDVVLRADSADALELLRCKLVELLWLPDRDADACIQTIPRGQAV